MKQTLTKDARGLVDGVVEYLRRDGKSNTSVPKIEALLGRVTAQARKEKHARVSSAVALDEKEKKHLQQVLSNILTHEVELDCRVDQSLIAGLHIQVGDWIVDTSLKSQLEEMAQQLQQ